MLRPVLEVPEQTHEDLLFARARRDNLEFDLLRNRTKDSGIDLKRPDPRFKPLERKVAVVALRIPSEVQDRGTSTVTPLKKKMLDFEPLFQIVIEVFGDIKRESLLSDQTHRAARARMTLMFMAVSSLGMHPQEVGKILGRDRTTVINARDRMPDIIRRDSEFAWNVAHVEMRIAEMQKPTG